MWILKRQRTKLKKRLLDFKRSKTASNGGQSCSARAFLLAAERLKALYHA